MWDPKHSYAPADFFDVLNDEELEPLSSDDDDVVENIEVDEDEFVVQSLDYLNLHIRASNYTVEKDEAQAPNVITDQSGAQMKAEGAEKDGGRAGRGRWGRSGRYSLSSSERRTCVWFRGELMVERFASEEELPTTLQDDCTRVTAMRERTMGAKRASVNLELEEDGSDAEEVNNLSQKFDWASMDGWRGEKENFLCESPGPTRVFHNAYEAFRSYWDDSLLAQIVVETNRYAQGIRCERFRRDWFETNLHELLILFAFWMMLGIHKMPTIKSCFSNLPLLRTEIFRLLFSQDRYWNMNRAFHLAKGSRKENDPNNLLYPMGPVIDQLNLKFKQNYNMHQDICINESSSLWKDTAGFKQYIKTKSARFGIKTYQLCESSTGYLWSFFVYTGRCGTSDSKLPSSLSTVVRLVQPLLYLGHVLYMDNWSNSPKLARYLKSKHTDCVGTLRLNHRHVPAIIQMAPLAEGEFVARQSGDVMLVALNDGKRISYISTFHGVTQVQKAVRPGRPSHHKLHLIDDYNQRMGGVNRSDPMLEPYLVKRKQCGKWTRKLFKRLLNITIQNARILLEQSSKSKIDSLAYRMALVQLIIDNHLDKVPSSTPRNPPPLGNPPRPRRPQRISYLQFPQERLTERHFIQRIPITDEIRSSGRNRTNWGRRQCVWCSANCSKRSKTVYECPQCKVPLCLEPCFEEFHTLP